MDRHNPNSSEAPSTSSRNTRALEVELERTRSQLDSERRHKTELLSFLSHEIRNQLASIMGYSELMYDAGQSGKERLDCISKIRKSAKNGVCTLQNMIKMCKTELGTLSVEIKKFSLREELTDCIDSIRAACLKRSLGFQFTQNDLPKEIISDPTRIREVLFGIGKILIDATPAGTVFLKAEAVGTATPGVNTTLSFTFESTNNDIAEIDETIASTSVNEPSFLDLSHTRTGMSLWIAKRLAETLSGTIQVYKSPTAKGGTVKFTSDAAVAVSASAPTEKEAIPEPADLSGLKILLIEDDLDIQKLISYFLCRAKAQVEIAGDGKEGLKKFHQRPYDLLLMDLEMPVWDGLRTTRELRSQGITTPIIALTAHAMTGVRDECLKAGCNAYLTKPFDANTLLEVITQHRPTVTAPDRALSH